MRLSQVLAFTLNLIVWTLPSATVANKTLDKKTVNTHPIFVRVIMMLVIVQCSLTTARHIR